MRPKNPVIPVAILCALAACTESGPTSPAPTEERPAFAKGGPPATKNLNFAITDAGMSLVSDGKGTYANGICGVVGVWQDIMHLAPAEGSIPKSQKAACSGIAPRGATLTLAVRHVTYTPTHVDEYPTPATYAVQNVKFGFGAAAASTINAAGSCGTVGLRFTSVTYPGSNDLNRVDLGGGHWHMYSDAYPNNLAYCDNGSGVTYWHVAVDLNVDVVP